MSTRVEVEEMGGARATAEPVKGVKAAGPSEIEGELERDRAGGAGVGSSRTAEK